MLIGRFVHIEFTYNVCYILQKQMLYDLTFICVSLRILKHIIASRKTRSKYEFMFWEVDLVENK